MIPFWINVDVAYVIMNNLNAVSQNVSEIISFSLRILLTPTSKVFSIVRISNTCYFFLVNSSNVFDILKIYCPSFFRCVNISSIYMNFLMSLGNEGLESIY